MQALCEGSFPICSVKYHTSLKSHFVMSIFRKGMKSWEINLIFVAYYCGSCSGYSTCDWLSLNSNSQVSEMVKCFFNNVRICLPAWMLQSELLKLSFQSHIIEYCYSLSTHPWQRGLCVTIAECAWS